MTLIGRSFRAGIVVFSVAPLAASLMLGQIVLSYAADPFSLYCMQRLVDSISAFPQNPFAKDAVLWIVLLAVATLFLDYVTFIGSLQVIGIQRKLNLGLTERIQAKFRRMDYACFEDPSVNDVIERMGAEPQQKFFRLFQGMTDIVGCIVATIGLTTVVSQASLALAFVLLGVIILMLFFEFKRIEMQVGLEQSQTSEERKMDYLSDLLGNKRSLFELRVFGAVDYIRLKWKMHADVVIDERLHTAIRAQKYHALNATCYVAWMAAVMVASVVGLFDRSMSLGMFVALVGTMRSLSNMYGTMNMAFSNIARNHLEIANYDRFMGFPEHSASGQAPSADLPASSFRIEFDDVTFSYPGIDRRILDGVTFSIEPGELVALVGCNGAGKSTIVKLLARLYTPDAGEIRIGGIPLADLSQAAYTKALSFVFQDFMRYKLTLREGVGLGCTAKLDDDVALCDALQQGLFCRPDEKVDLDCNLGKLEADGVDLSGGQWQRLAISRALVAGSRFVVLDEPTASFDPIAESKLYRSFAAAMQNRGCLMISHRLASARMCGKIVVLDKGRVVACGSHDKLMSQEGLYRRMFEAQAAWYLKTDADKDVDAFNSVERTDTGEHI